MNKNLKVKMKNNYGSQAIYPDCKDSKLLTYLTGKKTLTLDAVKILKDLGYTFEITNAPTI